MNQIDPTENNTSEQPKVIVVDEFASIENFIKNYIYLYQSLQLRNELKFFLLDKDEKLTQQKIREPMLLTPNCSVAPIFVQSPVQLQYEHQIF